MVWKKGQSGNPGGRNTEIDLTEIRTLARTHTKIAIDCLVHWARDLKNPASIGAAQALLDRGWGKPQQAVEVSGKDGGPLVAIVRNA